MLQNLPPLHPCSHTFFCKGWGHMLWPPGPSALTSSEVVPLACRLHRSPFPHESPPVHCPFQVPHSFQMRPDAAAVSAEGSLWALRVFCALLPHKQAAPPSLRAICWLAVTPTECEPPEYRVVFAFLILTQCLANGRYTVNNSSNSSYYS